MDVSQGYVGNKKIRSLEKVKILAHHVAGLKVKTEVKLMTFAEGKSTLKGLG